MKALFAVLILLLGAVGVVVTAIPFLECPDCGAAAKKSRVRKAANPRYFCLDVRTDCPRCGDGGGICLFNRFSRKKLDHLLATVIRAQTGAPDYDREFITALQRLVAADGKDLDRLLGLRRPGAVPGNGEARFVEAQERWYVLVIFPLWGDPLMREPATGMLLIDLEGSVLDNLYCGCRSPSAWLASRFLDAPAADAPFIQVDAHDERGAPMDGYQVTHGDRETTVGPLELERHANGRSGVLCRIGVREGEFLVIIPGDKRRP